MWPYQLKYTLTQPTLIYQSLIKEDGTIQTKVFPTLNNTYLDELKPLSSYSAATTITLDVAKTVLLRFDPNATTARKNKKDLLAMIEQIRNTQSLSNDELCDAFADAIYLPLLTPKKNLLPTKFTQFYPDLQ